MVLLELRFKCCVFYYRCMLCRGHTKKCDQCVQCVQCDRPVPGRHSRHKKFITIIWEGAIPRHYPGLAPSGTS